MRILVVEDDKAIAAGLKAHLRRAGLAVDTAGTVAAAWAALRAEAFDLVLLDLGLPDADGLVLLRQLRQAPTGKLPDPALPVLVMTARDEVASRITGLDQGADDYMSKPFDLEELVARIRALRRRALRRTDPLIRTGGLCINPALRSVLLNGQDIALSAREYALLLALVEVRPRVLSRTQIEAALYDWGQALESNAVEVHIHNLRKKLGKEVICTLRGVGYFVPDTAPGEATA